jgi:hypothetical protein
MDWHWLGMVRKYINVRERGQVMQLQEIDTLQDLILWAKENMLGALIVETEGEIIIQTGLESTMGGYLHPIEREGE